jgi:hypothetical protein
MGSISQQAAGHSSIKWLQEVGTKVGSGDGSGDGAGDGKTVGSGEGTGDGIIDGLVLGTGEGFVLGSGDGIMVGEQTGGDPSGASPNMGLSGRHSKAQHSGHPIPVGVGMTLQSGLITWELVQSAGRSGSS